MTAVFRDYDQAALDAQYEQRAWAANAEDVIARYAKASDAARSRLGEPQTRRYGSSDAETLDVYGSIEARCAFVFVHGGAWRRQSKRESAFAAETIVRSGASYVALGFALHPAITLDVMAAQVCRGIEWVHANVSREILLCGHSSGGHLAACALTRIDFVKHALVVSGIYDLLPLRLSSRNAYLQLDERLERELSPIRHVDRIRCPVTVAWGENESAEFARQSREFAAALKAPTLVGAAMNHFEVIEQLADAASPLGRAALKPITGSSRRRRRR